VTPLARKIAMDIRIGATVVKLQQDALLAAAAGVVAPAPAAVAKVTGLSKTPVTGERRPLVLIPIVDHGTKPRPRPLFALPARYRKIFVAACASPMTERQRSRVGLIVLAMLGVEILYLLLVAA
jgi:hypothetical protein